MSHGRCVTAQLRQDGCPVRKESVHCISLKPNVPGDSIDLAYADMNSRRGRVGHDIAHTLTPSATQGFYSVKCIDMNTDPKVTDLARCITARQDGGIGHHKGEKSAALFLEKAVPVLTPAKEKVRQQGRRFKNPDEPMFTITVTDRNGVIYNGLTRKLMPLFYLHCA